MTITYCDSCGLKLSEEGFPTSSKNIQHVYDAAGLAKVVCTGCRKGWIKMSMEFFNGALRAVSGGSDTPPRPSPSSR